MGKLEDGGVMRAAPDGWFGSQRKYATPLAFIQAVVHEPGIDLWGDVENLAGDVVPYKARWCVCSDMGGELPETGHWHFLDDHEIKNGRGIVNIWTYGVD